MCISSMCHACLERRMIYVKIQHFIPSRSLPSRKDGLCNHFPTAQKTSKISWRSWSHTKAGGEWRCGRKGHQESLQDPKKTMGWWKSRVHHDEHLEFTEIAARIRCFFLCIEIFRQGEDQDNLRVAYKSYIYIYMYIYKCHIQSTRKAMTGLLQRGWTPLSLCHRYDCRKLVLKWHPDKHPEGRGVVPSVDYVTLRADAEDDAAGLQVMWKTKLLDFKVWTPSQAHLVDRFLVFFVFGLIHIASSWKCRRVF